MRGHVKKLWREAATLILVARNSSLRSKFDYRVLLLERSSKSRFMPSREVFPGGAIDKCDFSNDWMDLYCQSFKTLGIDFTRLIDIKEPRPPIFRKSHTEVPSEIAFRICAIRETFEESGILLLRNIADNSQIKVPNGCGGLYESLPEEEIKKWRAVVHSDGSQFINLCRELQCVPDVWSLTEWSDWLTPADMKIRFDTAFFICFVTHEPWILHDNMEMIQSQWKTPAEAFLDTVQKKGVMGPPQVYNNLQFCRFLEWNEFKKFQESRAQEGCDTMLTVRIKCSDGEVGLFPGDVLYQQAYDHVKQITDGDMGVVNGTVPLQKFPETLEELRAKATYLNRYERDDDNGRPRVICNCTMDRGQISPLSDPAELLMLAQAEQSKL